MARISVIGPGAIGGTVTLRLMEAGRHSVTVCARSPLTKLTLEADGGERTVVPTMQARSDGQEPVDWVFVATKAQDAVDTAAWFPSLVGPGTRVAVLQNGVEHVARFAPYVPAARIVPVIVDMPIERTGPGQFQQRRAGSLMVPNGDDGAAFAELFAGTPIAVKMTPDFQAEAWRKLATNCAGAVSALVLKPPIIAKDEAVAEIIRALIDECVAVGRLEGANLSDGLAGALFERYRTGPADAINSLHADRIAGRPLEIDARNGAVVRFGRKHGVATPMNDIIVTLLSAASN